MGHVCKLLVASDDVEQFERVLRQQVAAELSDSEWPLATDASPVMAQPSVYSWQHRSGVIEVFHNSFDQLTTLTETLSNTLAAKVVVNVYQSVAEAGYWGYAVNGRLVRGFEFGDGVILPDSETGDLLPFESRDEGQVEDAEGCWFSVEDLDRYNQAVGIAVAVYDEPTPGWRNLQVAQPVTEPGLAPSAQVPAKPWWKFW